MTSTPVSWVYLAASSCQARRLAWAVAEGLHGVGLLPKRLIHHKSPEDLRYGTYLTNAISFGLLLGAAGIVAAILYVFIRMGAQ